MSEETEVQTEVVVPEIETEARAQGWVPQEEFRGDTTEWIDADTFVKRGREINPILRKNNERIQRELDATKRQMEELKKATDEFKKFQKESYDRKLQEYEVQLSDLKDLKKKAVTEGDGDMVVELDDQIDALKEQKAQAKTDAVVVKEAVHSVDPEVQRDITEWISENSWYSKDTTMAAAANSIAETIRITNPYLVGKEFLAKVDEELSNTFSPEKLGKKSRPRNPVEGHRPSGSGKSSKESYDSLPSEAKAACDKFVKQKLMTKEEYVANYDWS